MNALEKLIIALENFRTQTMGAAYTTEQATPAQDALKQAQDHLKTRIRY